jgi:hypothetical protein
VMRPSDSSSRKILRFMSSSFVMDCEAALTAGQNASTFEPIRRIVAKC